MLATEIREKQKYYLGVSILDINKIAMYEFWYDYMKPKYKEKSTLSYIDTDGFTASIKTVDFYVKIVEDVETRFDTSAYEFHKPWSRGKMKKSVRINRGWATGNNNQICCTETRNVWLFNRW